MNNCFSQQTILRHLGSDRAITDNLQKTSENGDDVAAGLTDDKFQHLKKYFDEQRSLGSLKSSSAPQNCFPEHKPRLVLTFHHFKYVTNYLAKQKSLHFLNHPSVKEDVVCFLQLVPQKKLSTHSQGHQTSSGNSNVAIKIGNSKFPIDSATKIQPNLKDANEIVDPNLFPDSNGHRLSEGHGLSAMLESVLTDAQRTANDRQTDGRTD